MDPGAQEPLYPRDPGAGGAARVAWQQRTIFDMRLKSPLSEKAPLERTFRASKEWEAMMRKSPTHVTEHMFTEKLNILSSIKWWKNNKLH